MIIDNQNIELLKTLITFLIIPLFAWVWRTDRKLKEIELLSIKHEDLKHIYKILDEIKKDINSLNDKFVSSKSCDFRHKTN
jgi:Tfp pilus assembly protein PilO